MVPQCAQTQWVDDKVADIKKRPRKSAQDSMVDQTTVMRTILSSTNPKLKLLWENIGDVTFVRDYRRKKKQPRKRRTVTDEDFIEEMFSEVGMEQDHDGFPVV